MDKLVAAPSPQPASLEVRLVSRDDIAKLEHDSWERVEGALRFKDIWQLQQATDDLKLARGYENKVRQLNNATEDIERRLHGSPKRRA